MNISLIDKIAVPFNKPTVIGDEGKKIIEVIQSARFSSNQSVTKECEHWLQSHLRVPKAMVVNSCTAALEMAALLINIKENDEVIMPSFTFVSTANAFVLRGAKPVFVDIRPDTLNINENLIEMAITKKTRAIVPVHYAGTSCEMHKIIEIANSKKLWIIEDAAQAILTTYKNKYAGGLGHLGCLSFHETKNISCGEGGALLINDDRLIERAEIIRDKGTDRAKYLNGSVDRYQWVDVGSSFSPSELVSAFLYVQLQNAEYINQERKLLVKRYESQLEALGKTGKIKLPGVKLSKCGNGHIFYIFLKDKRTRAKLIEFMAQRNITSVFHYIPLHSSPAGRRFSASPDKFSVTNHVSDTILRLPIYFGMKEYEQRYVIDCIYDFFNEDR